MTALVMMIWAIQNQKGIIPFDLDPKLFEKKAET